MMPHDASIGLSSLNCKCSLSQHSEGDFINEVHREERRRTWWLLFLMDRHLALCYNRSLALLEAECRDLLLPLDDVTWQSGAQTHSHGTRPDGPRCMLLPSGKGRMHGPPKTCAGVGLFEFFLPLMVHCGTLLDLNRSRLHPVLSGATMWSSQEQEILRELDHFQTTLNHVTGGPSTDKAPDKDMIWQSSATETDDSETAHIAMTVAGYATHIVNVLRILVGSKCEFILMYWSSSQSTLPNFTATSLPLRMLATKYHMRGKSHYCGDSVSWTCDQRHANICLQGTPSICLRMQTSGPLHSASKTLCLTRWLLLNASKAS